MPVSDYTPSLAQVGAIARVFTKDTAGNETGTFSSQTRPSGTEVTELINQAVGTLSTRAGDDVPVKLQQEAKNLAALRAAMLVIISAQPEQVAKEDSLYAGLRELWQESFGTDKYPGALIQAIEAANSGSGDVIANSAGLANFNFPPAPNIGSRHL